MHKTLATLRRDGSPRISGTEVTFAGGELLMGSMPGSRKVADLARDPRMALHSGSDDPPGWRGDAKLSGRAIDISEDQAAMAALRVAREREGQPTPDGSFPLLRVDIREAVITRYGDPTDHIVIEFWAEGLGLQSMVRR